MGSVHILPECFLSWLYSYLYTTIPIDSISQEIHNA